MPKHTVRALTISVSRSRRTDETVLVHQSKTEKLLLVNCLHQFAHTIRESNLTMNQCQSKTSGFTY